ncbi:MAG: DUF58 domain-containing protein [Candidatus Thermoplasmatota archaeon]|nr:DUF58 domain-containing protein [Candidatus Thermoplasmatota archaeon]
MWTEKSILICVLGILLIFLALILKNFSLATFAVFIFSMLVVGAFTIRKPNLKVTRELSTEKLFEEGSAEITLYIKGKGTVELKDELPKVFALREGNNCATSILEPAKSYVFKYSVECPLRGVYTIGPLSVRTEDPFSMFYKESRLDIISELIVFPKIEELKEFEVRAVVPRMIPGTIPIKYPGRGLEFFSMRDYVSGDPFKDINWKVYSRLGKLMVVQRELETISDVTIILDARSITGTGYINANPLVYSARACASIAAFFIRRRCNVGLITYSNAIKSLAPGYGERQLYKILCALAEIKSDGSIGFSSVARSLVSIATPQSVIILISSLEEDDSLKQGVKEICDRGYSLTVLTPSALELERGLALESLEILKLEREILVTGLKECGAEVIEWRASLPLAPVLEVMESKWKLRLTR